MRVAVIFASSRKEGNSAFLARQLLGSLKGTHVVKTYLHDLEYTGCSGCMACRKASDECVLRDDLSPVLRNIKEAEVTIIAVPVYFEQLAGQFKCLLDRCFSFLAADHFQREARGESNIPTRLAGGKTAVPIIVQGQGENAYEYIPVQFERLLRELGFTWVEVLRGCRLNGSKDCRSRKDLWEKAVGIAERLNSRYVASCTPTLEV